MPIENFESRHQNPQKDKLSEKEKAETETMAQMKREVKEKEDTILKLGKELAEKVEAVENLKTATKKELSNYEVVISKIKAEFGDFRKKMTQEKEEANCNKLQKEIERLKTLVVELEEEEELNKIKAENYKRSVEQKNQENKDIINNLKDVKSVLQQEVSKLKKELENAKVAQNADNEARKVPEFSNPVLIPINEGGTLDFESNKLSEAENDTDSRVVNFEDMRSELAKYKAIEQQKKKDESGINDDKTEQFKKIEIENLEVESFFEKVGGSCPKDI